MNETKLHACFSYLTEEIQNTDNNKKTHRKCVIFLSVRIYIKIMFSANKRLFEPLFFFVACLNHAQLS